MLDASSTQQREREKSGRLNFTNHTRRSRRQRAENHRESERAKKMDVERATETAFRSYNHFPCESSQWKRDEFFN